MKIENNLISSFPTIEDFSAEDNGNNQNLQLVSFTSALSSQLETILKIYSEASLETSYTDKEIEVSPSDMFHWGYFWDYIKENNISLETVCGEIRARRIEINSQKDHWRSYTEEHKQKEFTEKLNLALVTGYISPCEEGSGSAYFLYDQNDQPVFVIKPVDEDILCLNNRKHLASPFIGRSFRVRDEIPLYRSAQTDALAYEVAGQLGMAHITPKTEMWVIHSDAFYDLTLHLSDSEKQQLLQVIGGSDNEKLCSVQEYVSNSVTMQAQIYKWIDEGASEKLNTDVCADDFEDANLFVWTTLDTDAHPGNFLLYNKEIREDGSTVYGIKKIDNGLSFPERNAEFVNFLMYFDTAQNPISSRMREKIATLPIGPIIKHMQELEMSTRAMAAFVERVRVMQELCKRESLSIYEMNLRLMLLSGKTGITEALGNQNVTELEQLIGLVTIETHSSTTSTGR